MFYYGSRYIYSVVAIVLLLAINAFFVAAEFALVKAKSFRINLLAQQGGKSALLTQRIQSDLESYLAACPWDYDGLIRSRLGW